MKNIWIEMLKEGLYILHMHIHVHVCYLLSVLYNNAVHPLICEGWE